MLRLNRMRWLASVFVAAYMVTGCSGAATPTPEASSSAGKTPVKIAFIAGYTGVAFYTSVECGARAAAKDHNVDLIYTGSTAWDINLQMPLVQAAVQTDPQGIVLAPTDSKALVPIVKQEMDKGIPLVTIDAPLDEPVDLVNMQSNHYEGGVAAAKAMIELTGGKGIYLAIGMTPGLPDIGARLDGFVKTMQDAGATILPIPYPGADSAKAAEVASAAIQANSNLTGIYATFDGAASGAASAILQAGAKGKIRLVAFDADPQQARDLKDGIYDALIAQEPYKMGYNSVKLVAAVLRGEVDKATQKHDQPTEFAVITRANMGDPAVSKFIYAADLSQCPTGAPD